MVAVVSSSIEIAASPEYVRAKFLEFDQIPKYSPEGFIRWITPDVAKPPIELQPGDTMKAAVGYGEMKVTPRVAENSPAKFAWDGGIAGIFFGFHSWNFNPIEAAGSGRAEATLLVHQEEFSGVFSFLFGKGWIANWLGQAEKTRIGFGTFNRDFKKWVEEK
ncbi:hypothetical protein MMC25_005220 [Agyrium rufum]|nr:hypothetical protein [Agyrium rufum]